MKESQLFRMSIYEIQELINTQEDKIEELEKENENLQKKIDESE